MQTTLCLGPVDFYYEVGGQKFCVEANAGDTNFISPFVKHSFARRSYDGTDAPGIPAIVALIPATHHKRARLKPGRSRLQDTSQSAEVD